MSMVLKTKKGARMAGLKTAAEWNGKWRIPKLGQVGCQIKGEIYYSESETEELISRTKANKLGLAIPKDCEPEVYLRCQVGNGAKWILVGVYRVSVARPKRVCTSRQPVEVDLLLAIWTVNRTAKRLRNCATNHYLGRRHGLAQHCKNQKQRLYDLKDRGIAAGFNANRLQYGGIDNGFALYTGDGYCFHSTLLPIGVSPEQDDDSSRSGPFFVEAKPKTRAEARLKDAIHTLTKLEDFRGLFCRRPFQERCADEDYYYC